MDVTRLSYMEDLVYMSNKNKSYRVAMASLPGPENTSPSEIKKNIEDYKWRDGDFLQANFLKCGTHLVWEIMWMLLKGRAEYMDLAMELCLIDITPFEVIDQKFTSPRVLNTHYRLDLLPDEYQNRKTVFVIRNPKDTLVSDYNMVKHVIHPSRSMDPNALRFEDFFDEFLDANGDTVMWGNYFKFIEYMWELSKTHPDMLVLHFEDIVRNPVQNVQKLNEFMGTGRDDKLIREIANATEFKKMKQGKLKAELQFYPEISVKDSPIACSTNTLDENVTTFRKGVIGDWKNWFTVAMNERFDEYLQAWKPAGEIHFIYE